MKITNAWAKIASQNSVLRLVVLALLTGVITLLISNTKLSMRAPLIIERSCASKMILDVDPKLTQKEIQSFIEIALKARFDSNTEINEEYLSISEQEKRKLEQRDLKSKNITQKVILSQIKSFNDPLEIETDRLISIGKVRSAFSFPLKVFLKRKNRSASNPYGLVISKIEPFKLKKDSK